MARTARFRAAGHGGRCGHASGAARSPDFATRLAGRSHLKVGLVAVTTLEVADLSDPGYAGGFEFPAEFRLAEERTERPFDESARDGEQLATTATSPDLAVDSVVSEPLRDLMERVRNRALGVVLELNADYAGGRLEAVKRVDSLIHEIDPAARLQVNGLYVTVALHANVLSRVLAADDQTADSNKWPDAGLALASPAAIRRAWPNFETRALTVRSVVVTKCQAVRRMFNGTGRGIVWAVLDSGIDGDHGHFEQHGNLQGLPHRSFLPNDGDPLRDDSGHGTHVAGIIAGEHRAVVGQPPLAAVWTRDALGGRRACPRPVEGVSGMAPECSLLSCKVLRGDQTGDVNNLLAALSYIHELNDGGRHLRVHGVNISIGHPYEPYWQAVGRTPVCKEVDRLVNSGVVVVVAAGNTGFGYTRNWKNERIQSGFALTINDPGNAESAITVGSTSTSPHTHGVSYFSSKGPTGDGRLKPDLLAPGERIISAGGAHGALLREAQVSGATYVEDSGTSMAAPHVSGAAAAFLSVHPDFIGRPADVKRVLLSSATDLGRSAYFQGAGLLDALRAVQSV